MHFRWILRKKIRFRDADRFRHPNFGDIMDGQLNDRQFEFGAADGNRPAIEGIRLDAARQIDYAYRYYRA